MSQANILVLFAHPSQHRSEVNAPIFKLANTRDYVTAVDLYAEYPRLNIDIDKEQQRLLSHDIVIFQFPIYWYSTPAILKEWQDLVLEYGFAYGHHGKELEGKSFLCAVTAGGSNDAYRRGGHNNFTVRELFRPLEQTAIMTGMHYLPPLTLFGSRTAADDDRLHQHLSYWRTTLEKLHHGAIKVEDAENFDTLNDYLAQQGWCDSKKPELQNLAANPDMGEEL